MGTNEVPPLATADHQRPTEAGVPATPASTKKASWVGIAVAGAFATALLTVLSLFSAFGMLLACDTPYATEASPGGVCHNFIAGTAILGFMALAPGLVGVVGTISAIEKRSWRILFVTFAAAWAVLIGAGGVWSVAY